jgi:AcrR family transcriptional regulator
MATAARPRGEYAKSAARREAIVAAAIEVFGESGYWNGSLREVAERAGLSQPGLLHHFSSKTELLLAVLTRRDELTADLGGVPQPTGVDFLRLLPRIVERNMQAPGLVALFTVLSAEASAPDHPAHDFFRRRSRTIDRLFLDAFESAGAQGVLRQGVAARSAATGVGALMDGLQVQWLYDRTLDMAGEVRAYLSAMVHVPI